jgi:predicted phage baseplate assembly protein
MTPNRPGLSAISYRIGTFATFFEAMMARLSSADYPGLTGLRARDSSDWSIALLDGWAAVADILTFYQERIANEGYLRTATERLSVLELGRTVGYALRPGVAATAYFAYTMDPSADVTVPAGTRAQSVPAQGQLPQSFETSGDLHARGAWNALGVRKAQPQNIDLSQSAPGELYLQGANLKLNPDDVLLIVDPNHTARGRSDAPLQALVRVVSATPYTPAGQASPSQTHLTLRTVWLQDAASSAPGASRARSAARRAAASSDDAAPAKTAETLLGGYSDVAAKLLAAPAAHPPNALRLPQTIATAFAADSDAIAKTLAVIYPALEATLLPALQRAVTSPAAPVEVYAFRISALPFGANAPLQLLGFAAEREDGLRNVAEYREWTLAADEHPRTLYLDRAYPSLVASNAAANSYVAIVPANQPAGELRPTVAALADAGKVGRAQYGISGTVSKLTLAAEWYEPPNPRQRPLVTFLRHSQVYAQSERLTLADVPIAAPLPAASTAAEIELDDVYDGLEPGRWLIVAGTRTDVPGAPAAELVMLSTSRHSLDPALPGDALHTTLTLSDPLSYRYDRPSVQVYANVVRATHGETRSEVLGSGDGSLALQQFTLKASPLTYVPAQNASGVQSTLQVTVNGLPWFESSTFDALGPTDRAYVTQTDDSGKTTLTFGDGVHGARLPTGVENVTATYRVGIGQAGNVAAAAITLLATRPLGVKATGNPLPASGGADPEDAAAGRSNVPLAAAALDRIVSVADYAALARTFAGVAKAVATRLPGAPATVQVTLAADGDAPVDATSPLLQNLVAALTAQGDSSVALDVRGRSLIVLILSANVLLQAGYQWESVATALRSALLDAFGFDRRALAQDVFLSEVVTTMQAVAGVDSVSVTVFEGVADGDAAAALAALSNPTVQAQVVANAARRNGDGTISPAQLAIFKAELGEAIVLQESGA